MTTIDWSDLESGFDPGPAYAANFVVRGRPGAGKTTFVSGIPHSLLLSCETKGGSAVVGGRADRLQLRTFEDFKRCWDRLMREGDLPPDQRRFQVLIFDTIGQFLEKITYPQWCVLNGCKEVEGFDHSKAAKWSMGFLRQANAKGYFCVSTDHILDQVISTGAHEKVVTQSVLSNSFRKLLDQECSHIFTLELREVTTDQDGKSLPIKDRYLKCVLTTKPGRRTSLENPKSRVWIPQEIDIPVVGGWDAYVKEYDKAVEEMKKLDATTRPAVGNG